MESETYLKVEVKYCERCGGLWLRHAGSPQVYCAYCAPDMAEVARGPKKQPRSVKLPVLRGGAACA
jgi:Zn-finger nucleic acid-binding protein